jgi:hypothetical protein
VAVLLKKRAVNTKLSLLSSVRIQGKFYFIPTSFNSFIALAVVVPAAAALVAVNRRMAK